MHLFWVEKTKRKEFQHFKYMKYATCKKCFMVYYDLHIISFNIFILFHPTQSHKIQCLLIMFFLMGHSFCVGLHRVLLWTTAALKRSPHVYRTSNESHVCSIWLRKITACSKCQASRLARRSTGDPPISLI